MDWVTYFITVPLGIVYVLGMCENIKTIVVLGLEIITGKFKEG